MSNPGPGYIQSYQSKALEKKFMEMQRNAAERK